MVNDKLYEKYIRVQNSMSRTHFLASMLYSYFNMERERKITVKDAEFRVDSFTVRTVDINGISETWIGFTDKESLRIGPGTHNPTVVCYSKNVHMAERIPHSEIMSVVNGTELRKLNAESRLENMLVMHPLPYYEGMPMYGKYLMMKSVSGTVELYDREEFINSFYDYARKFSFGMNPEDVYSSVNRTVDEAISAGIIETKGNKLRLRGKNLVTQKSFNNYYYGHYEKIYKTTLYDF
ncbi:MAG: hypothetical protein M1460_04610 [Candidatus Thermoplasmatota archaeon]|nr:hypothetical protein [Candidatus Thermoplasmatota archaeon]